VDRRNFVLFLTLSALVLMLNQLWVAQRQPPPQPGKQHAAAEAGKGEEGKAGEEKAAEGKAEEGKAEGEKPPAEAAKDSENEAPKEAGPGEEAAKPPAEAEAAVPAEFVTLGSVDEPSGYRMLVTLTNQGAGVRRIELANSRYLDLHDRSGYLGHLELATGGGAGLVVQAVGPGTPAAAAGLKVGDRILEAGRGSTSAVASEEELAKVVSGI
jgi:hypothetical protein